MARKRKSAPSIPSRAVTPERAARLHRLLRLFAAGPQTREALARKLRLDVRSFYRDLELLRDSGIELPLIDRHYVLKEGVEPAIARLPFPDPRLTLGEAIQLARGRSVAHQKLKALVQQIIGPAPRRKTRG